MRLHVVLLLSALGSSIAIAPHQAVAAPRSSADCEAIRDWHAYNTCLASFSNRRGERAARAPRAGNPEEQGTRSRAAQGSRRAGAPGLQVQRVAGGRVRATLDIGAVRRR